MPFFSLVEGGEEGRGRAGEAGRVWGGGEGVVGVWGGGGWDGCGGVMRGWWTEYDLFDLLDLRGGLGICIGGWDSSLWLEWWFDLL